MSRRLLLGLLLIFGLLAAVYSLVTPLFEAPDEPQHYAYVRWLAEGHGLPPLDDDASGAQQEAAQPPLYYVVAGLVSSLSGDDDLPELFWHNPQFGYQAGGTVNDNKNMLIHSDRERFPWRDAVLAVRLARMVSLAFGLLLLGATYGLAREAFPERPALVVATVGVVAFTPQVLFISGVVSNDSAAAAVSTCALWALARIIRRGATPRRSAAAGLTLGLAMLSKTSTLLLLPMAVFALWLGTHRLSAATKLARAGETWGRTIWREAVLILGLASAAGGWWYLRNWAAFNDPLGLQIHINTPWGRNEPAGLKDVLSELPQVFRSFWGAFGWGHVELFSVLYIAIGILVGLAALGWARIIIQRRDPAWTNLWFESTTSAKRSSRRFVSATAGILLLAAWWCLVVLAALIRWMQQVEAPHGRLLFPALGAWAMLLAVGWSGLSPGCQPLADQRRSDGSRVEQSRDILRAGARCSMFLPLAGLFILSVIVPFAFIRPAFAAPRLFSPEDTPRGIVSQALIYDAQARLLGYRVEPESVPAGGRVEVTLCWEALRAMDQDYTLFIHLLGRDNLRVGERTTYPGQGRFPTTLWPVGRAFCDSYWLDVAPWAPTPEVYALEVGLYDGESGWRLPSQDAAGQPIEPPAVGLVRVIPTTPPPLPEHARSYDFGRQITLLGYDSSTDRTEDSSTTLDAGDTLTLTLYWEALQVPQGEYTIFAHLLDHTGALVTQDDAPPRGGRYPTRAWQQGDIVPDTHQVKLPDPLPPGPYIWSVGIYDPDTRDRLPVVGPEGPLPNGAVRLEIDWN